MVEFFSREFILNGILWRSTLFILVRFFVWFWTFTNTLSVCSGREWINKPQGGDQDFEQTKN